MESGEAEAGVLVRGKQEVASAGPCSGACLPAVRAVMDAAAALQEQPPSLVAAARVGAGGCSPDPLIQGEAASPAI